MTLVELLVVVVILLLLLVSVGPILSPSDGLRGREAAATLGAMLDRAQRRAATNGDRGAGIWLEPVSQDGFRQMNNGVVTTLPSAGALDLFACEPQNAYIGDDPESARVFIHPVNAAVTNPNNGVRTWLEKVNDRFIKEPYTYPPIPNPTDAIAVFWREHCPSMQVICGKSSKIEIDGIEYYFRLYTEAEQLTLNKNYLPEPFRDYDDLDYTNNGLTGINYGSAYNNIVLSVARLRQVPGGPSPHAAPSGSFLGFDSGGGSLPARDEGEDFKIARPLTRSATPPLTLPDGYCVDLAWSCVGVTFFQNEATAPTAGSGTIQRLENFLSDRPVQVLFDREGAVTAVTYKRGETGMGGGIAEIEKTVPSTGDIYFLIGRVDRAANGFVVNPTEENPGANWQYPDSRWVKISKSTGVVLIADPYYGATDVIASQQYARNDIPATRN